MVLKSVTNLNVCFFSYYYFYFTWPAKLRERLVALWKR